MSKFKNKFYTIILILGIICSAFLLSACNWGRVKNNRNNINNYNNNSNNETSIINTVFSFIQIGQKIDDANSIISDAIFNSNVYLKTTQTITDYFFEGDTKEKSTTQTTTTKIISIDSVYEKTYYQEEDQLAEYWYVPNITLPKENNEYKYAMCSSYNQYYKSTMGDEVNYYGPTTIKEMWVLLNGNDYRINDDADIDHINDTLYDYGFINEQISQFYPGFDMSFIIDNSASLSMQQYSDYSYIITLKYNQYEFEEAEETELAGMALYSYNFYLDSFGKLVKSEFSTQYQTADGKCLSDINYVTEVNYNYSKIPSLQKEEWN